MKNFLRQKKIKALIFVSINLIFMFFSFYAYFKDINFNFKINSQSPAVIHLYYWDGMNEEYKKESIQVDGKSIDFVNFDIPVSCSQVKLEFESDSANPIYIDNVNLIKAFNNADVNGLDINASKGILTENDGSYTLLGDNKSLCFVNLKDNIRNLLNSFNWFFNITLFILLIMNLFVLFGLDISYKNILSFMNCLAKGIRDNMAKSKTTVRLILITLQTLIIAIILSIGGHSFYIHLNNFSDLMICIIFFTSTLELLYELLGKFNKNNALKAIAGYALINFVTYYAYILLFSAFVMMLGNGESLKFFDLTTLYCIYQFYSFTALVFLLYLQNRFKNKIKFFCFIVYIIFLACVIMAVLKIHPLIFKCIPIYPIFLRLIDFVNGKSSSDYFITIFIHVIFCSIIVFIILNKRKPLKFENIEGILPFKFNFKGLRKKYKLGLVIFSYIIIMFFLCFNDGNPMNTIVLSNANEFSINISQEYQVEQILISKKDEFSGIGLPLIKTKDDSSYINIKMVDENNKVIIDKQLTNKEIDNTKRTIIRFNSISNSYNKKYKLVLSNDLKNSSIFIMSNKSDAENYGADAQLSIAGIESEYNLSYVEINTTKDTNYYLMITITIIFVWILLCLLENKRIKQSYIIISIYLLALIFNIYKGSFYINYLGRFPDEEAHIGYLAYVHENDNLIPEFEKIKLVNNCVDQNYERVCDIYEESVSYLGHPPLYYKILDSFNIITVSDEKVSVNIYALRFVNLIMSNFALAIYFYLGYKLLNKNKTLNLFFAISCVSIPLMSYLSGAITNDNLSFVASAVFFLGAYKFLNKESFISYLLIAIGIACGMLAKITTGMMLSLCAFGFIVYKIVKEKSLKCILRKEFLLTMPIYLLVCAYFLIVYSRYGTFQPSQRLLNEEFFKTTIFYVEESARVPWNRWEHAIHYWKSFRATWTGIFSHVKVLKGFDIFTLDSFAISAIMYLPILYLFSRNEKDYKKGMKKVFLKIALIAIYITMVIQFIKVSNDFQITGYTGGYQTRYYLCVAPVLALSTTLIFKNIKNNFSLSSNNEMLKLADYLIYLLILLMLYGDFIYLLINCTEFLS